MPDQPDFTSNPLAAIALLMAATTPNPSERLDSLNSSINNFREAINQINSGLNTFNTEVMPMFMPPEKNKQAGKANK